MSGLRRLRDQSQMRHQIAGHDVDCLVVFMSTVGLARTWHGQFGDKPTRDTYIQIRLRAFSSALGRLCARLINIIYF